MQNLGNSLSPNNRILIFGGPGRGKSTFASKLAHEHKLTHLCTDPQHLLPLSMNGTPDDLDWAGENGVGQWVAKHWLGRERTVIEGCHLTDAVKHWIEEHAVYQNRIRTSRVADRIILLTSRPGHILDEMPGQARQAAHVQRVLERYAEHFDNLEHWVAENGQFRRLGR